jgi:hypothetical protein
MSFAQQQIEKSAYCRSLYKTNKYECDVRFYE